MPKANDRQEGGSHYHNLSGRKDVQHWDLARIFNWDPFQYQITKYVMRWKDKHPTPEARLVDLKKARHFLDKYIEDAETWDQNHVRLPAAQIVVATRFQEDIDTEYLSQMEAAIRFEADGFVKDGTRYQCKACRSVVLAHSPLGANALHTIIECEVNQQRRRKEPPKTSLISASQEPSQSANGAAAPTPSTQLL